MLFKSVDFILKYYKIDLILRLDGFFKKARNKKMTIVILNVPKLIQSVGSTLCGPTCLAMVFQYYGHNITTEDIAGYGWSEEHFENGGLSYSSELSYVARKLGFKADLRKHHNFETIVDTINSGAPMIARIHSKIVENVGHFVVIKGFYADTKRVLFNDPSNVRRKGERVYEFNNLWNSGNGYDGLGIIIRQR